MPHLDHARVLDELPQESLQVLAVQAGVFEGHRKLDQERAQLPFARYRIQALTGFGLVRIIGTDGGGRGRLHHRQRGMRK